MNILPVKSDYQTLIYEFRGYKVMLDYDLASLYGVETKRLKEQVRRNISRFPGDFMFEINQDEFTFLRSQIATSKRGGTRYFPMAFTEQGVAMLSSVLNSEKAIQVNIEIMRAFANYRALLLESKEFRKELRVLDEKIDQIFKFLLKRIDALSQKPPDNPRKTIGFRINHKEQ
ncbi:MAG: ORF6N domain-containing protein [Bacteroidetes bacterium]|nr:ORF6N domain-containing protein [Bacteroidota bacterium]